MSSPLMSVIFLTLEQDEDADVAIIATFQIKWNGWIVFIEKAKTITPYYE